MSRTTPRREEVLHLIREERTRQVAQYGTNESLDVGFGEGVSPYPKEGKLHAYPWLAPFSQASPAEVQQRFRQEYEWHVGLHGKPTWMHLIREEVAELFETTSRKDTIAEAIQVAALCASLAELLLGTEGEEVATMTDEEWTGVEHALVRGGLRDYIDNLLHHRTKDTVMLSDANRRILLEAYDDGMGHGITLVPGDDPAWFVGKYEGDAICEGVEYEGVLYTITHLSGGGLVSVVLGRGLLDNEMGIVFHSVNEAKAYIQGRMAL